jgi:hypothetical protein
MRSTRRLLILLVTLLPSVTGVIIAKQKRNEGDYKIGWLESWSTKTWGPDVYYDSQNGFTCFAAHDHELPQCFKDSSSDEWVVRASDDNYMQITEGESSPLLMLSSANKDNALLDLIGPCLASVTPESTKQIATEEVQLEDSVPQGRVTVVSCAVQIRYRTEGKTLYVPLYHEGKLVDEAGYDNVFLEHTPGGVRLECPVITSS